MPVMIVIVSPSATLRTWPYRLSSAQPSIGSVAMKKQINRMVLVNLRVEFADFAEALIPKIFLFVIALLFPENKDDFLALQ